MTYYLDTYGCVKNQVDAENMMAALNESGWTAAEDTEGADLIIVNSCGFIESAKKESINAVLGWRKLYPEKKILLAGCLAQRYAKELAGILPEADGFFGIDDPGGIAKAAGRVVSKTGGKAADSGVGKTSGVVVTKAVTKTAKAAADAPPLPGSRPLLSLPGSAYVKISEGCDNRCSFCAIPLIRGGLRSRTPGDIIEECKALLSRGIKELCLIGQDTGSYGMDQKAANSSPGFPNTKTIGKTDGFGDLPGLMESISKLNGDFWVRTLYIHPDHFPLPILDIMESDKRFLPYFDIPFQHASEKLLKAMNRRGNAETYLGLIETLRRRLEDAVIRTTFMTGFPGETEEDFASLLDFQKKAQLDWAGCFAYSREENTPAYKLKGRMAKKTAIERKRIVEEGQISISEKQMERFVGRTLNVLVEEKFESQDHSTGETDLYLGRLPCQAPEVDGSTVISTSTLLKTGTIIPCRIVARAGIDLEAQLLDDDDHP
jgi:ribosomal protein S12 methylthiotransferase